MHRKKFVKWFLFPHPAFFILLIPSATALLAYSLAALDTTSPISIASYLFSFYVLTLLVLRAPACIRFVRRIKRENRYISRYTTDVRLRMNLSLFGSFAFSAVYAAFQLGLGLWHHSVWFYSMAGYYLLLALMRLLLVRYTRRHSPGEQQEIEWNKYRFCGICLLIITLALAIFIIYFVLRIREFRHHEITTITMAAYSFASLALAIRNAIRYKSYGSPAYSAAKAISLVTAIVSMLTLENAMLTSFGQENNEAFRQIMIGSSGAAVVLTVQGIAVYMIVNAQNQLRRHSQSSTSPHPNIRSHE